MRYEVFQESVIRQDPDYLTQKHMERTYIEATKPTKEAHISFNEHLDPEFRSCSVEEKTLRLLYHMKPWMLNTGGSMHGGIIASLSDMSMGLLARYFKGSSECVTVHLGVEYLHGIAPESDVIVECKAEKVGKRVIFLTSKVYVAESGKLAAIATAEFM
ncbi:MAG: PaaI family thioesterase [Lachnospiraceae bacterium]|nr:PaaI family thioesterase [Lachnospiraceae bacterium]